jgi:serine/threonine protein kinase
MFGAVSMQTLCAIASCNNLIAKNNSRKALMSSSVESASTSDAFTLMSDVIVLNGWVSRERLEKVRDELLDKQKQSLLKDARALGRYFMEMRLITSDQMLDIDSILQQQPNFPHYHLQKRLGAGGMGTVYLAQNHATGKVLALKTMIARLKEDADFVGRFHRESEALAGLKHPAIAEVYESGNSGNACYMAMEYIQGPSFASLLKEHKVIPEHYALLMCRQLAEGLAYVYDKAKLVHRDIKPENILIARNPEIKEPFSEEDRAKLIDFGLVKPASDDQHLTQTGMTIGTPLYMSPEQIRGEHIDCRSDIYGLGATMYHLLTGQTPFSGTSPGSIMSAHLTQPVPDPGLRVPSLKQKTRDLIMMAMAKKRDDRFASFSAFIKSIDEILAEFGQKNTTSPKLLRKPLILKAPVRKTPLPQNTDDEQSFEDTDEVSRTDATDRILQKFKQGKDGDAKNKDGKDGDANSDSTKATVNKIISSTFHQRPPTTNKTKKTNTLTIPTDTIKPKDTERSAVYDEDPRESGGTGMIPWIVLGAAILALAIYYFL